MLLFAIPSEGSARELNFPNKLQFKFLSPVAEPRAELRLCSVTCGQQSACMHNELGLYHAQL